MSNFIAHRLHNLYSLEMWGGATFDVAMRFLQEDPFERLRVLREAIPNICFQMLLRASNAVGYTAYPDNVVKEFITESAANGIDIFRVFDSLNWLPNMRIPMEAVRSTNRICEAAICYTGDILDPKRDKYSLQYYVRMAKELEQMGAHVLAIKDMAGLCKPYAAEKLVRALREEVGLPVHFHTHDTSGINAASILKAAEAGVDVADGAIASMSGTTSQPNLNSVVAALNHTERDTVSIFVRSTRPTTIGRLSVRTTRRSTRLRSRERRKCTCTRCRAGSTPICESKPSPWDWARAGLKWLARMPR
jgi:pyruvate carboxylase